MKSAFALIGSKKILWQKSKLLVVSNFRQTVRKVFDSFDSRRKLSRLSARAR